MKIHFKTLAYQLQAVQAVADCFVGQARHSGMRYTIDPGRKTVRAGGQFEMFSPEAQAYMASRPEEMGFGNHEIDSLDQVLSNIRQVQIRQGLEPSTQLITADNARNKNLTTSPLNLNIEMETGTGKTYVYLRTIFELNKRYGWSKFIIVVPSIAIREGVYQSIRMMGDHFMSEFGKKAKSFIYSSKSLHDLESFSSDGGINIMVINVQAFNVNARGKDQRRRIYDELDEFGSRRPIDVISRNRPILILDEPQKMAADKTLESLAKFKPLFILRYSATHKKDYNLVHRLDALDAYNQKLVKKIHVKGIQINGLTGSDQYLYLQDIKISKSAPEALIELEVKQSSGFRRAIRRVKKGDDLYIISNEAAQYKDRYIISEIDARTRTVAFANGKCIKVGEAVGDVNETALRTIQIRETIRAHLDKERQLYMQGIKVLSLFFIDEVAKYRQYNEAGQAVAGEYAQIFAEQYQAVVRDYLDLNLENDPYQAYLKSIEVDKTHQGYFSVDKRTNRLIDPRVEARSEEKLSSDSDAYDLILKDKERLLSLAEPVRFIFSHSALREGWDNPNVFTICTLKHSDNVISRRQEVGRGLRLAVNQSGERMDANYFGAVGEVHKLNQLTVITNESYTDFVKALQGEIRLSLSSRPTQATPEYFKAKQLTLDDGKTVMISETMAKQIHKYLTKHDYIDDNDHLTEAYHMARQAGEMASLPEELQDYGEAVFVVIDGVMNAHALSDMIEDANQKVDNPIQKQNLARKEFQQLWQSINRKATYQIHINSTTLQKHVKEAILEILRTKNNRFVETLSYTIAEASQKDEVSYEVMQSGQMFNNTQTSREKGAGIHSYSQVKYDLIDEIAKQTDLTRKTVVAILKDNAVIFSQYRQNPEAFIREMVRVINQVRANLVIQNLNYDLLDCCFDSNEIFMDNQIIGQPNEVLDKHIWQYVTTDSAVERRFAKALDGASEVVVYAKLPDKFYIPTPFGNYNPDWAIVFEKRQVRNIYFVAETKGSVDENQLRTNEQNKIGSARKYFEVLNRSLGQEGQFAVKYDVVRDFEQLRDIVAM